MEPRPSHPERDPRGSREPEALEASEALQRALKSLRPVSAPTALDERVSLECATEVQVASWLRGLPPVAAPAVLDRLVSEELADPARVLAERFTGDLAKQPAPRSLRRRLVHALNSEDARPTRAHWGLIGSGLAAAALALMVFWPQDARLFRDPADASEHPSDREVRSRLRLKRVTVASANELTPMAALLADSLAGGIGLSAQVPNVRPLAANEGLGEVR
jgi:hypothetical protein